MVAYTLQLLNCYKSPSGSCGYYFPPYNPASWQIFKEERCSRCSTRTSSSMRDIQSRRSLVKVLMVLSGKFGFTGSCVGCYVFLLTLSSQCCDQFPDTRRRCDQEGHQCLQQEDLGEACAPRDKVVATFQRTSQRMSLCDYR